MQANRNKRVYGPIASNHEGCILDEIHRTAAQCDARCAGFAQKALNDRK
jgi:hypothetical protein